MFYYSFPLIDNWNCTRTFHWPCLHGTHLQNLCRTKPNSLLKHPTIFGTIIYIFYTVTDIAMELQIRIYSLRIMTLLSYASDKHLPIIQVCFLDNWDTTSSLSLSCTCISCNQILVGLKVVLNARILPITLIFIPGLFIQICFTCSLGTRQSDSH